MDLKTLVVYLEVEEDIVFVLEVFGLSHAFIRFVQEARRKFCITLDGVVRTRSLTGVLLLFCGGWRVLLLSGEIIDETARFKRWLVGVRSKLKARLT